MILIQDM